MNSVMQAVSTPRPFSKELDPMLCYAFSGHKEAAARLDLMIQHRTLGVLTGEVGGDKSTLIRRLFASLDPMTYLPIYLCYANLKPREFYAGLLEAVGVEPVYTVSKARKLWQEVVRSRSAPGEKTLAVIIDEAHEMSEAMLLELRFALNYNMDSAALFPLILVGQPELRKLLRLKKYEATLQRVGMHYHLGGMNKDETSAYIRHHMTVSRTEKPVFAESALGRIFAASQGLPRVVNQICTQILLDAAARNLEVIEEAMSFACSRTWIGSEASRINSLLSLYSHRLAYAVSYSQRLAYASSIEWRYTSHLLGGLALHFYRHCR